MGNSVPNQPFPFWTNFPYWKALTLAYFWRSGGEKTSTNAAAVGAAVVPTRTRQFLLFCLVVREWLC